MFAAGFLDFFFTALWFALLIAWIALSIQVFIDLFRNHDMSGVKKALWALFIIVLPYLGVFTYIVLHSDGMAERRYHDLKAQEAMTREYIREAAGTGSDADALDSLARLREAGHLTDDEFAAAKARVLQS